MMFSEYVGVVRSLWNLPAMTFLVFVPFTLIFWLLWKLFRGMVLNGHPLVLALAGLGVYALTIEQWTQGQPIFGVLCFVPLAFIGAEAYRRLVTY